MRFSPWLFAGTMICTLAGGLAAQQAPAAGTIIPAPPIVPATAGAASHSATQNPVDPTRAHDATTGQNLTWDEANKTWVDAKTKKPIPGHFRGKLAKDGTVIPAPPAVPGTTPGTSHSATQDAADPEKAHDGATGQDLTWDRKRKSWIDAKTGRPLPGGYRGHEMPPPFDFDSNKPPIIRKDTTKPKPLPPTDSTKTGFAPVDTNFPPPKAVPRKPVVFEQDTNKGCGVMAGTGKYRAVGRSGYGTPMAMPRIELCHPRLAIVIEGSGAWFPGFGGRVADLPTLTSSSASSSSWGVGGGLELSSPASRIGFGLTVDHRFSQRFTQTYAPTAVTEPTTVRGDVHGTFVNAYVRYQLYRSLGYRPTYFEVFGGPTWAYDWGCYRSTYYPLISGVPTAVTQNNTREESGWKVNIGAQVIKPVLGPFEIAFGVRATTAFKSADADQNLQIYLGAHLDLGSFRDDH